MNWLRKMWADIKALVLGRHEAFVGQAVPETQEKRDLRRYKAPEGLTPRLLEMYEQVVWAKRVGMGVLKAEYWLWRLINERCPETRLGLWCVRVTDQREVFIEEKE